MPDNSNPKLVSLIYAVSGSSQKTTGGSRLGAYSGILMSDQFDESVEIGSDSSYLNGPSEANVPAIISAVDALAEQLLETEGTILVVKNDQQYMIDYLNESPEDRQKRNYRKRKGKGFMADGPQWQKLDDKLLEMGIRTKGQKLSEFGDPAIYESCLDDSRRRANKIFASIKAET